MHKLDINTSCMHCGFKNLNDDAEFCPNCGEYLFNHCSNRFCTSNNGDKAKLHNSYKFCDLCGSPTTFLERGLLSPSQE